MKVNKIYIFGLTTSGKSTLATSLSKKLKIKAYSLDDIVWKKKWTERFPKEVQKRKLRKIIVKKKWIIEGVHTHDWVKPVISKADQVIFLNISKIILIKRAWKRKNSLGQKLRLIYWVIRFGPKNYLSHKNSSKKFIEIKNIKEIDDFIKKL